MSLGYWGALGAIGLLALVILLLACWTLSRGPWLWSWLRANLGLVLLLVAVAIGLLGYDYSRYQPLRGGQTVATLSFSELSPQHYQVRLTESGQDVREFELEGDLWQLELRRFNWHPELRAFGFASSYRLEQLRSRYYLLEQELQQEPAPAFLNRSFWSVDLWRLLAGGFNAQSWLQAARLQSVAMPMADGALYEVHLGRSGQLEVRAVNAVALARVSS